MTPCAMTWPCRRLELEAAGSAAATAAQKAETADESERLDALAKLVHGTAIASPNQPRAARAAWVETRVRAGVTDI